MTVEFKLPDLGEGIHEAEIIAVKVKEGEMVKEDQIIFEVETDKAVVEIPSPYAGAVAKIHVAQGQTVKVGCVMIGYDIAAKTPGQSQAQAQTQAPAAAASTSSQVAPTAAPVKQAVAAGHNGAAAAPPAVLPSAKSVSGPVPATPATRRLARELGIDLHQVNASGPAGRVLKEDVMAYAAGSLESRIQPASANSASANTVAAASKVAAPSMKDKYGGSSADASPLVGMGGNAGPVEYPDFSKFGDVERLPLKSIRRKIAMNMTQAWTHIPHVTHFDEANVTELTSLVTKYEKEFALRSGDSKVRPTLTVFTIKALASALKLYPQFNSSLDENTGEIVIKHYYNIGVAVATERGLIVPVIKNVDQKSFYDIAAELADIAAKTRAGKIELERLQGGTFTLTNIGAIGGTSMSPMVNFPEAAILGMARASQKPIVKDNQIVIGTILPLAMSFDHRLADGAEAAYFVQHVVKLLEDPFKFVLEA
ncbi:pyruvate dehydrogenase complex dihydrolipoyllysine-residue acetyltransferase [soil metagenome]